MAMITSARKFLHLNHFFSNSRNFTPILCHSRSIYEINSFSKLPLWKIIVRGMPVSVGHYEIGVKDRNIGAVLRVQSRQFCANVEQGETDVPWVALKKKRKKLKGRRAVNKWLKFFRFTKKKEYERMTTEERILFKLTKARRKEARLVEALKKIEPKESSETIHDPEILTPEEHFYFLKMGQKSRNYVPVGRRGLFKGVILNMHLHWKKHQTLQVIVKNFTPDEVKEIASELARLSGGIVLDIEEDETIIMYRGKNYSQPPTEIMSPRITLSRKKALDKSKLREALRGVKQIIPRLEQELELLQAQAECKRNNTGKTQYADVFTGNTGNSVSEDFEGSDRLKEILARFNINENDDSAIDSEMGSDSLELSDMFETDSESENEEKMEKPLYLDAFDKIQSHNDGVDGDLEDHLSENSRKEKSYDREAELAELDEVDRIVIRAASLLKKKNK